MTLSKIQTETTCFVSLFILHHLTFIEQNGKHQKIIKK